MRISDWSSDVCSSDLIATPPGRDDSNRELSEMNKSSGTDSGNTLPGPVSAAQRIHFLDALRGFALSGILLMNIEWFNRSWAAGGSIAYDLHCVDHAAGLFVNISAPGRFHTLFSLLFG